MVLAPDGYPEKIKSKSVMNKSTRFIVTAAAMAGLYAGSMATRAYADGGTGDSSASKDAGKHDCKGQNSCKSQGGCKAGDNGCKGQNSCKGKGGCSTNKSSDQPSKVTFA
jgi:hypothetical protein